MAGLGWPCLIAGFEVGALAGPHHWRRWTRGTLGPVDTRRHLIRLQDASPTTPAVDFRFNDDTLIWDAGANTRDPGRRVTCDALTPGVPVWIWSGRAGGDWLAVRIVLGGERPRSPESPGD